MHLWHIVVIVPQRSAAYPTPCFKGVISGAKRRKASEKERRPSGAAYRSCWGFQDPVVKERSLNHLGRLPVV